MGLSEILDYGRSNYGAVEGWVLIQYQDKTPVGLVRNDFCEPDTIGKQGLICESAEIREKWRT